MRIVLFTSLLVTTMAQTPATVRTARYPNRFQRECAGDARASYARRAACDGDRSRAFISARSHRLTHRHESATV